MLKEIIERRISVIEDMEAMALAKLETDSSNPELRNRHGVFVLIKNELRTCLELAAASA